LLLWNRILIEQQQSSWRSELWGALSLRSALFGGGIHGIWKIPFNNHYFFSTLFPPLRQCFLGFSFFQ
jgi:hypothetical protein